MSTSEVSICNSALAKIGARRILAFSDDLEEARLCSFLYPILRDKLLRSHPWRFAVRRSSLAQLIDAPLFDYSYAFQIPEDCLRVLGTSTGNEDDWKQEGDMLVTNNAGCSIRYIARITDVSKFDANFSEVLAYEIALETVYPLTQNASLTAGLEQRRDKELRTARSYSAQVGSVESVDDQTWITTRY